jgi:hypothetical protein
LTATAAPPRQSGRGGPRGGDVTLKEEAREAMASAYNTFKKGK